MSKGHKDLPAGSQPWAQEVDADRQLLRVLLPVVKRLAENAGLDFSNPLRGINAGTTPSIKNPVGQKLSSLADVQTYNVLDEQVLSWSQQGQRWLPITLPEASGSGAIDIPMAWSSSISGYGQIDSPFGFYAYTGTNAGGEAEMWGTNGVYVGNGDWSDSEGSGYSLIEQHRDILSRPYVKMTVEDYTDGTSATATLSSYKFRLDACVFVATRCTTAGRPTGLTSNQDDRGSMVYDTTLNIPIWWNGTTWTNALGTAV